MEPEHMAGTHDPGPSQLDGLFEPKMIVRRRLLKFLAASPLVATPTVASAIASLLASAPGQALAQNYDVLRGSRRALGPDGIITAPGDALNVFEFEPAAKKAVLSQDAPAHWGYLESGVDGDVTRDANHTAYQRYSLRVKRLIDARKVDASIKIFGETWGSPIFICPVSSLGAYDPEAGVAVARAAGKRKHQMILSTVDNASIADANKAHGSPAWFQLYPTDDWVVTQALVNRAEASGTPVIVLTVDRQGGRNTEDLFRARRLDERDCTACHTPGFTNDVSRKANFFDIDVSKVTNLYGTGMTWEFVDRLRGIVKGKLLLKGIMTGDDASRALSHGVDGILVSNHGGRAEESGQATIGVLAEVVGAVDGRIPVLVDGGVRRGTDVLKALALGATAVGIGRPYVWGLASFGEAGVDRVLEILDAEFVTIMRQAGALNIKEITRGNVTSAL
ncbi:alpha-hydroxy acid oxidase [Mesorhizobium escarrei]|uniref:4-hydroxymandelate oxidase n=1 Tax=Mesorhizobium escarrei TaxID=666018 RepID=A0ABM9DPD6_9HYPH|nr:alpha-hydroxy acid oxidase [Mesorhizobium escarrei]CAH2398515.1 4-hydroxymandelate oxidase [Mesorhizobium escarrei]